MRPGDLVWVLSQDEDGGLLPAQRVLRGVEDGMAQVAADADSLDLEWMEGPWATKAEALNGAAAKLRLQADALVEWAKGTVAWQEQALKRERARLVGVETEAASLIAAAERLEAEARG